MKKIVFSVIAGVISCGLFAQIKQERKIDSFTKLKASHAIEVIVTLGDKESVAFEAEEKVMDKLKAEVKNGELKLYCDGSTSSNKPMKAYVTAKSLTAIEAHSAAGVEVKSDLSGTTIKLSANEAAHISIEVNATEVVAEANSAGSITVKGSTKDLKGTATGAGELTAKDLKADNVVIMANGAGNATVYAKESLNANASGAGSIKYSGDPKDKKINVDISGSVKKS